MDADTLRDTFLRLVCALDATSVKRPGRGTRQKSKWSLVHLALDQEPGATDWSDESKQKFISDYNNRFKHVGGFTPLTNKSLGQILRDRRKTPRSKQRRGLRGGKSPAGN